MIEELIGESWVQPIGNEFYKDYLQKMGEWISHTRKSMTIYPDSEDVFKALKLCPFNQVKVVILGQDPYYNGVADGLAFSYKGGVKVGVSKTQSLDVIFDEIERDCYEGFAVNRDYDLSYLAKQGVLLLNTCLTVFRGKPGSHVGMGWEKLTKAILLSVIREKSPKVFMTWGNHAKASFKEALAMDDLGYNHLVLEAPHPAADLYNKNSFGDIIPNYPTTFSGCKHFSKANQFLKDSYITPIDWFPTLEPYFNIKLSDDLMF